jgi:hypothetical protein
MDNEEPLLTARAAVELARKRTGAPVTLSRWHKDRMNGFGPEPAAIFGKTFLYRAEDAIAWARNLLKRPTPSEWISIGRASDRALAHLNTPEEASG